MTNRPERTEMKARNSGVVNNSGQSMDQERPTERMEREGSWICLWCFLDLFVVFPISHLYLVKDASSIGYSHNNQKTNNNHPANHHPLHDHHPRAASNNGHDYTCSHNHSTTPYTGHHCLQYSSDHIPLNNIWARNHKFSNHRDLHKRVRHHCR